jgi:molybdopterin molybdotransferase
MSKPTADLRLSEAWDVVAAVPVIGSCQVDLSRSYGRIIRQGVRCDRDYPATDISTRDGYCFDSGFTEAASNDAPVFLKICGGVRAGEKPAVDLARGQCAEISTGAALPRGADTVVPAEDVRVKGDRVIVSSPVGAGCFVLKAGAIANAGKQVALEGSPVTAAAIGLLASLGIKRLRVSWRPAVGVLATGDELVPGRRRPRPWQVRGSNRHMLSALLRETGASVRHLGTARDSKPDIVERILTGKDCDVVIVTGGSSNGPRDLVAESLLEMGCEMSIRGLNLRPGRHMVFAVKDLRLFFALPGNPVGCLALFNLVVKPAIMSMMGATDSSPASLSAFWRGPEVEAPETDTLAPSNLDANLGVRPVNTSGSGDIVALMEANCFAMLARDGGPVTPGDRVTVFPMGAPSA